MPKGRAKILFVTVVKGRAKILFAHVTNRISWGKEDLCPTVIKGRAKIGAKILFVTVVKSRAKILFVTVVKSRAKILFAHVTNRISWGKEDLCPTVIKGRAKILFAHVTNRISWGKEDLCPTVIKGRAKIFFAHMMNHISWHDYGVDVMSDPNLNVFPRWSDGVFRRRPDGVFMRRSCGRFLLALVVAVFLVAGCASTRQAEIPFGQWAGHGAFAAEKWPVENLGDDEPASLKGRYSADLRIGPGLAGGRDVIEMEILSEHGAESDADWTNHFKIALVKAKQVSDDVVLYRVVAFEFNPKPFIGLQYDDSAPPYGVSCIAVEGATILQIQYDENWYDTIRFSGDTVEKSGVIFEKKEDGGEFIHWAETLIRRK